MLRTPLSILTLTVFLISSVAGPLPRAMADDFRLPVPGVMVHLSPPLDPPILKGIKVYPDNPFRFDFILDQGDSSVIAAQAGIQHQEQLKIEATKLIKYFLASLTTPEKDLWVNLSPYEKGRVVPQSFGLTEMGRDLLAEDYMLKQITASLVYPEDAIGKKFWKRIYAQAAKKFGTTNIPVNTFNKVWIVPEKAVVYENAKAGTAFVVESKLKVMLEQDYLATEKNLGQSGDMALAVSPSTLPSETALNVKATQVENFTQKVLRQIVIPELTKEVNEDKNFSRLRQVYNSLILATWYKKKIKDSLLERVYADRNKIAGIQYTSTVIPANAGIHFKNDVEGLYQEYLKAFKKGVYNYIKEESDPLTQEIIPRKYFSGGMDFAMNATGAVGISNKIQIIEDPTRIPQGGLSDNAVIVQENTLPSGVETQAAATKSKFNGPDPFKRLFEELSISKKIRNMLEVKRKDQAIPERKRTAAMLKRVQDFVTGTELLRNFPSRTLDRIRNVEIIVADDIPQYAVIFHRGDYKFSSPIMLINAEFVRQATDAQLAYVIGHEIGHLLLNHVNDVIDESKETEIKHQLGWEIEKRADVIGVMAAVRIFGEKEAQSIPETFDILKSMNQQVRRSQKEWGLYIGDEGFDVHMPIDMRKPYLDRIRRAYATFIDSGDMLRFLDTTFDAPWPENMNEEIFKSFLTQDKQIQGIKFEQIDMIEERNIDATMAAAGDKAQLARQVRTYLYMGLLPVIISAVGCVPIDISRNVESSGLTNKSIVNIEAVSKGRINYINGFDDQKPTVLLIHGAADDNPTQTFNNIVEAFRNTDNVLLYSYDFRAPINILAMDLNAKIENLKDAHHLGTFTIMPYSYGNVVSRYAFLLNPDLFHGDRLIQLAPTAGGSKLAEGMNSVFAPFFTSIFSHANLSISETQNPDGHVQEFLYNPGSTKIIEGIFSSILTIRAEKDEHSLERSNDPKVREHYVNGIGREVITIPGVTHGDLPYSPELIKDLKRSFLKTGDKAQLDLSSGRNKAMLAREAAKDKILEADNAMKVPAELSPDFSEHDLFLNRYSSKLVRAALSVLHNAPLPVLNQAPEVLKMEAASRQIWDPTITALETAIQEEQKDRNWGDTLIFKSALRMIQADLETRGWASIGVIQRTINKAKGGSSSAAVRGSLEKAQKIYLYNAAYDKTKPVIVFLGGIGVSPVRSFMKIFERLKDEYNIAFFEYDDLRPVEETAGLFNQQVQEFLEEYKIQKIDTVVAYSMGGTIFRYAEPQNRKEIYKGASYSEIVPALGGSSRARAMSFKLGAYNVGEWLGRNVVVRLPHVRPLRNIALISNSIGKAQQRMLGSARDFEELFKERQVLLVEGDPNNPGGRSFEKDLKSNFDYLLGLVRRKINGHIKVFSKRKGITHENFLYQPDVIDEIVRFLRKTGDSAQLTRSLYLLLGFLTACAEISPVNLNNNPSAMATPINDSLSIVTHANGFHIIGHKHEDVRFRELLQDLLEGKRSPADLKIDFEDYLNDPGTKDLLSGYEKDIKIIDGLIVNRKIKTIAEEVENERTKIRKETIKTWTQSLKEELRRIGLTPLEITKFVLIADGPVGQMIEKEDPLLKSVKIIGPESRLLHVLEYSIDNKYSHLSREHSEEIVRLNYAEDEAEFLRNLKFALTLRRYRKQGEVIQIIGEGHLYDYPHRRGLVSILSTQSVDSNVPDRDKYSYKGGNDWRGLDVDSFYKDIVEQEAFKAVTKEQFEQSLKDSHHYQLLEYMAKRYLVLQGVVNNTDVNRDNVKVFFIEGLKQSNAGFGAYLPKQGALIIDKNALGVTFDDQLLRLSLALYGSRLPELKDYEISKVVEVSKSHDVFYGYKSPSYKIVWTDKDGKKFYSDLKDPETSWVGKLQVTRDKSVNKAMLAREAAKDKILEVLKEDPTTARKFISVYKNKKYTDDLIDLIARFIHVNGIKSIISDLQREYRISDSAGVLYHASLLEDEGYEILAFRFTVGEVMNAVVESDILARKDHKLSFVEVKDVLGRSAIYNKNFGRFSYTDPVLWTNKVLLSPRNGLNKFDRYKLFVKLVKADDWLVINQLKKGLGEKTAEELINQLKSQKKVEIIFSLTRNAGLTIASDYEHWILKDNILVPLAQGWSGDDLIEEGRGALKSIEDRLKVSTPEGWESRVLFRPHKFFNLFKLPNMQRVIARSEENYGGIRERRESIEISDENIDAAVDRLESAARSISRVKVYLKDGRNFFAGVRSVKYKNGNKRAAVIRFWPLAAYFPSSVIIDQIKSIEFINRVNRNAAMTTVSKPKEGGINLNSVDKSLQVKNQNGEIKFNIDPAMLQQLQNAPGFVPVIINIQPMHNLRGFLGLNQDAAVTS